MNFFCTGALAVALTLASAACNPESTGHADAARQIADGPALSNARSAPSPGTRSPSQTARAIQTTDHADQWQQDYQAALDGHLHRLAMRHDARSQLLFALLSPLVDDGSPTDASRRARADALALARQLDPGNALVAWLEAIECRSLPGCRPAAALVRLQQLEPDNAAVWLLGLDAAYARGDQTAVDRYLRLAAQADRYDDHYREAGALVIDGLREVSVPPLNPALAASRARDWGLTEPVTDEHVRAIHAGALASALSLPGYLSLSRNCGVDPRSGIAHGLAACDSVLSLMAGSDTLLPRLVGMGKMVQLTAATADGAVWRERFRRLHWQMQEGRAQAPSLAFLQSMWVLGEVPALQAALDARGASTPPTGWLPNDARARALITTGREPPRG